MCIRDRPSTRAHEKHDVPGTDGDRKYVSFEKVENFYCNRHDWVMRAKECKRGIANEKLQLCVIKRILRESTVSVNNNDAFGSGRTSVYGSTLYAAVTSPLNS